MKKYNLVITFLTVLTLFVTGCNFQLPEKLTVKSTPVLKIPLGGRDSILAEQGYGIETLLEDAIADIPELSIAETENDSDPLTLELTYDIQNISLGDLADQEFSMGEVSQTIEPMLFEVPEISVAQVDSSVNMDTIPLPALTFDAIDFGTLYESAAVSPVTIPGRTVNITGTFTTLTFSGGSLLIDLVFSPTSPAAVLNVNTATLSSDGGATSIGASALPDALTGAGTLTLSFPLAGETIGKDFTFNMTASTSAGNDGDPMTLTASAGLSPDAAVSAATGVDLSTADSYSGSEAFPINIDSSELISATLNSAHGLSTVDISIAAPSEWSGVTITKDLTLIQNKGLGSESVVDTLVTTLETATLDISDIILSASDTLTLDYIITPGGAAADISISESVDEFTITSVVNLAPQVDVLMDASSIDMSSSMVEDLEESLTDLVSSVKFQDPMIYVSILNELPIDMIMTLDSTSMEVASVDLTFSGNAAASDTQETPLLSGSSGLLDLTALTDSDTSGLVDIDFDVYISSPEYDGSSDPPTLEMTVSTSGASYNFSGEVGLYSDDSGTAEEDYENPLTVEEVTIIDWNQASTMPEDYDGTNGMDLGSSFTAIDDILPGLEPQIQEIQAYLEVNLPPAGGGGYITVNMYSDISYDDADGNPQASRALIYDATDEQTALDAADKTTVARAIEGQAIIDFTPGVFEDIMNNRGSNVVFNYNAGISSQTIPVGPDAEDLEILISVHAFIPVEIGLENGSEVDIDLDGYTETVSELLADDGDGGYSPIIPAFEDDMFGRSDSSENEEFFEMVTGGTLHLEFDNSLLKFIEGTESENPDIFFTIEGESFYKLLTLNLEETDIELTADDITGMISEYPFTPSFHIYLSDGVYRLCAGDISLDSSWIEIQSELNYEYELGGAE